MTEEDNLSRVFEQITRKLAGQPVTRLRSLYPGALKAPSPSGYSRTNPDGSVFVPDEVWLVEHPSVPGMPVHVLVAEGTCHTFILPYDSDGGGGAAVG